MPKLAFVTSRTQSGPYSELLETLRYELAEQDIPSTVHTGFPVPSVDLVYVLVAPDEFFAAEGSGAVPPADFLSRTIFLSARRRPAIDAGALPYLEHYRKAGAVFDGHLLRVAALRAAGVDARPLRLGYSPRLDRFESAPEPSIDVAFVGSPSAHRSWQLDRCACLLGDRRWRVDLVEPGGLAAAAKWDLLTRTRIVLNIHAEPESGDLQLEWPRVLDAIHAGAVVVTEHSSDIAPLVPGKHLLSASPESFRYVLESALDDDERRRGMRVAAYERIRKWLPLSLAVSRLRAAAVALVGRPALAEPHEQ